MTAARLVPIFNETYTNKLLDFAKTLDTKRGAVMSLYKVRQKYLLRFFALFSAIV